MGSIYRVGNPPAVPHPSELTPAEGLYLFHTEIGCAKSLGHVRLFVTPWSVASLPIGFSRQEYWRGSPCPPLGDLPDPEMKLVSLTSPALAGGFFSTSATWEVLDRHHRLAWFRMRLQRETSEGSAQSQSWSFSLDSPGRDMEEERLPVESRGDVKSISSQPMRAGP